jgi:hypothetical protein
VGHGDYVVSRWWVAYEYEVSGRRYQGEGSSGYRPQSQVRVYYSADDPSVSVLEPGVDLFALVSSLRLAAGSFLASHFCYGAAGGRYAR